MCIYVSVYIFALACFHLVCLVLVNTTCVGGWGVSYYYDYDYYYWADIWTTLGSLWDDFGITLG